MALPNEIENQLIQFLKPKIVFSTTHSQYSFNNKWLIDVNEDYFKKGTLDILLKVNNHLKVGLENRKFLKYLVDLVDDKLIKFHELENDKIHFINEYVKTIKELEPTSDKAPKKEEYSIDYLLTDDQKIEESLMLEDNYYYDLRRFANKFNNYTESVDIEKVKLNYVLRLYYDSLMNLYRYLDSIIIDFETINFAEYEFDYLLDRFGFKGSEDIRFNKLCHVNLTKKDTAILFMILMDEGLFEFDKMNEMKNKVAMEKFIESNFTYQGKENLTRVIRNMKQEFSELVTPKAKNQLPLIKQLISILQARESKISSSKAEN